MCPVPFFFFCFVISKERKLFELKERFSKEEKLYHLVIRSVSFLLPIIWNCFSYIVILKPDFLFSPIKSYISYCHSALFSQDEFFARCQFFFGFFLLLKIPAKHNTQCTVQRFAIYPISNYPFVVSEPSVFLDINLFVNLSNPERTPSLPLVFSLSLSLSLPFSLFFFLIHSVLFAQSVVVIFLSRLFSLSSFSLFFSSLYFFSLFCFLPIRFLFLFL